MCFFDSVSRRRSAWIDTESTQLTPARRPRRRAVAIAGIATLDRHDEEPEQHQGHDEGGVAPAPVERHADDTDQVERPEPAAHASPWPEEEG